MKLQISENIRALRKQHGLMQEQLAEALGVSTAAVSKWERGTATPELGFILQMAELFEVSVDVLVGYEIRSGSEEALEKRIRDLANAKEWDEAAAVAEKALVRYPNHFSIVHGSGRMYELKGIEQKDKVFLERAIELFRRAIVLLPQNTDPEINEYTIQTDIAQCYICLEKTDQGIEILKKYNPFGCQSALIGMLYACNEEYKPEEAETYLTQGITLSLLTLIRTMMGYIYYYRRTGNIREALNTVNWMVDCMETLKINKDKIAYVDKMKSVLYAHGAVLSELMGDAECADAYLLKAWQLAVEFDQAPDYGVGNIRFFLGDTKDIVLYDDIGVSVKEAVELRLLEEEGFDRLKGMWQQWQQNA